MRRSSSAGLAAPIAAAASTGDHEVRLLGRRRVDLDPDLRPLDDEVGRARGSRVQRLGDGIRKEADRVRLLAREPRRRLFPPRGRRGLRRRVLPLEAAALFAPEALEVLVALRDLVAARGRIDREAPVRFDEPSLLRQLARAHRVVGRRVGPVEQAASRELDDRGLRESEDVDVIGSFRGSRGRSPRPCPSTSSRRTRTVGLERHGKPRERGLQALARRERREVGGLPARRDRRAFRGALDLDAAGPGERREAVERRCRREAVRHAQGDAPGPGAGARAGAQQDEGRAGQSEAQP